MSETPHANVLQAHAELQQASPLHEAVVSQYMQNRVATGARIESRFLDSLVTTDTPYLQDGYTTSVASTTATSRRTLLRTARELQVFDDYGFTALRAGVYACANGEISLQGTNTAQGAEATYTPSTPLEGKIAPVALPGDQIVAELQKSFTEAPAVAMSESAVSFADAPELFSALIGHSLQSSMRSDGYAKIHNTQAVESMYRALSTFMHGDPESAATNQAGIYYNAANQVAKYVLPDAYNTGYSFVFEPVDTAQTNLTEGAYRVGFVRNDAKYNTQPDYSNQYEATPFALTEDARAFCSVLETAGLMPNQNLIALLSGDVKRRYGDSIAHATALLSSIVNDPKGTVQQLFDTENATEGAANLRAIREQSNLPAGAKLLIDTLIAINERSTSTALPVSKKAKNTELYGICKDVESYYAGAIGTTDLKEVDINGVPMLEKTHGQHTYMLREQTMFNGVAMPAGTVMIQLSDDGWAAGRISAFAFNTYSSDPLDDARRVFGSQLEEMLQQGGNEPYNSAKFAQVCSKLS